MKSTPAPQTVSKAAAQGDLSEAEIHELDDLLAAVPAPFEAVDAVMLDGYLCGILVQPVAIDQADWLGPIFGETEEQLGPDTPDWHPAKHERMVTLINRRKEALHRAIVEDGWFDPIVPVIEDDDGNPVTGKEAFEGLGYWVAGFEWALANFTALEELGREGVPDLLDSLWRHLPAQDETQQAMTKALDEEHPLKNMDEAIQALVFDVVDLAAIGIEERHRVTTVVRDQPKVGRNDPCPCGSGKKYKQCHGANAE